MRRCNQSEPTRLQIAALTVCLPLSGAGILFAFGNHLGKELWVAWLIALLGGAVVYTAFAALLGDRLAAKPSTGPAGKIAAGFLLVYALAVCAAFLSSGVAFWQAWTMPKTPPAVFAGVLAVSCAFGAYRGLRAVGRLSVIVGAVFLALAVVDTLLLASSVQYEHLAGAYRAEDVVALLPQAGAMLVCLMLPLPFMLYAAGRAESAALLRCGVGWGYAVGGAYLLLAALRQVLLLGPLMSLDRYPLLRVLKMVKAGVGLSRMEFLGILAIMSLVVLGGMCMLAVGEHCLRRLAPLPRLASAAIIAAALFAVLCSVNSLDPAVFEGRYLAVPALLSFAAGAAAIFLSPRGKSG